MQVLIDASDNSLDPASKSSIREDVVAMEPMSRMDIEKILELQDMFTALKDDHLSDVVWNCCGGVPQHYFQMKREWKKRQGTNIRSLAMEYCRGELRKAIETRRKFITAYPEQAVLLDKFHTESSVSTSYLEDQKLPDLPSPNKVFRLIRNESNETVIIPASNAMGLVLKYRWTKTPSVDELIILFPQNPSESS